ncbi:TIGR03086 family metal-binding protein [Rhodococcus maanshanensis]|uniref:TIGR03086 family protein n=1 Tax=Rhodococcus maanshanensis TaxID=183556 RepID=A0A1H7MGU7_9NOCA|nr:TIGR03086 family metal-binding protein [Rhodococcus maanshanensis]SEL10570.1 TIGR03086 family protein [Rhodococcus maanshanensis]
MDLREHYLEALALTGGIIAGLSEQQLDLPTPCDEWDVRAVISHLNANARAMCSHLSGTADDTSAPLTGDAPATPDPRADFGAAARELTFVLTDDAVLDRSIPLANSGAASGSIAIGVHFVDVLTHGWDLSRAIGIDYRPAERRVATALKFAGGYPDSPDMRGPGALFAPARPLDPDAPALDRLAALLGRDPQWSATPVLR